MNISTKLKDKLDSIPLLPGIYKMLDSKGNIIYIGKSKCLKKRVRTYFSKNPKWNKVEKLVLFIDDIDYEVTDTHLEARLLECKLIKELKPIFNSQMKNDERYVYLKVVKDFNEHKALTVESRRSDYSYGPFRQRYKLYEIIDALVSIFPITENNGGYQFDYNPIPLSMDQTSFNKNREILIKLFSHSKCMNSFIQTLEGKMKESAESYKYETASKYRDIIKGLNYINYRISDYTDFLLQDYLLKIPTTCGIKLFLISNGHILSRKNYEKYTSVDVASFINEGYAKKQSDTVDVSEKAAIDYHDIIYSEVKSLAKEAYNITVPFSNISTMNIILP